ncbi:hypothetical protein [Marinomonas shanghaiensis]|uniref:hypothetical protein n=1 Tax=Marinomonas shanghaiensis TaxID=2202418 RepID=UPI003A922EB2
MPNELTPEQIQRLLEYANSFDAERNKRWVNISHKLAIFDHFLVVTAQGLGKLDSKLLKEDELLVQQGSTSGPFGDMSDHITMSYLWVLGAYEVIRSLEQRAREKADFLPEQKESLQQLKWRFERLRIPLAKFEAAKKYSNTDSHIASPGVNTQLGIAWQVSQDTWITRRELSDSMLELFESINA